MNIFYDFVVDCYINAPLNPLGIFVAPLRNPLWIWPCISIGPWDISKEDRNRCLYKCLYIEAFDHQLAQLPWNATNISNGQVGIIIIITKRTCIFVSGCLAIRKIRSLAKLNGVCVFQVNVVDQPYPGIHALRPGLATQHSQSVAMVTWRVPFSFL